MELLHVGNLRGPVILLGATSLVGSYLIDRLVGAKVETLAISRTPHASKPHVTWIEADVMTNRLTMKARCETAISAAPIWVLPHALPGLFDAGVRRLVAFSSTSRFTKENSHIATERAVAQDLKSGEDDIRSFCEAHGIAWTILRPTVIYAEGLDRSITRLADLIRRFGVFPLAGNGSGKRQPVHAADLALGALNAAISPAAENKSYNVPGGETLTYRAMTERIFEAVGKRPRIVSVPPPIWKLAILVATPVIPGVTAAMGSRMAEDLTFDAAPAERDFAWRARDFRPRFQSPSSGPPR
jgi:nucleoside-diphosphate-sugar epimerase